MKRITPYLIAAAVIAPVPALADAHLVHIVPALNGDLSATGTTADIPEFTFGKEDVQITLRDIRAEEENGIVTLSPKGEGTVVIGDGEDAQTFSFLAQGSEVRLSETDDGVLAGEISAPSVIMIDESGVEGRAMRAEGVDLSGTFSLTKTPGGKTVVSLRQEKTLSEMSEEGLASSSESGPVTLDLAMTNPAQDLSDYETPFEAIADGFAFDMDLTGDTSTQTSTEEETGRVLIAKADPWTMTADANDTVLSFSFKGEGGEIHEDTENGIGGVFGPYEASFALPSIAGSEEPFRVVMKWIDIRPNETAWAKIDPTGALDRAPLSIDTALFGVLAPDAFASMISGHEPLETPSDDLAENVMEQDFPFQEIGIETFAISGLGASIDGEGAFTIDPLTMEPKDGESTFRLTGVQGLIDTLVTTGLIAEADAEQARMMLAMFSKAEGEDTSTITLKAEESKIFLNGNQFR